MKDRVSITMLEDGIADVRLIRADKMNALDPAMCAAIDDAIDDAEGAWPGLRVVVLSGEGRAFCAGLDLSSAWRSRRVGAMHLRRGRSHGLANAAQYVAWGWRELPVPVIAAAHGVAFGGGLPDFFRVGHPHRPSRHAHGDDGDEMGAGARHGAVCALWRTAGAPMMCCARLTYTNREFSGSEAKALGFATHVAG